MLITRPHNEDYTNDINLAKSAGIDAFVINYGGWGVDFGVQDRYLQEFYQTAERLGYQVFMSIDCTSVTNADKVVQLANQYSKSPAQLRIDGKMVLTTFMTNPPSWNWQNDVLNKINTEVLFIPGTLSDDAASAFAQGGGNGIFPWIHPNKNAQDEAQTDERYASVRNQNGQKWMAGIAPWFFKRFDGNNNWSHAQDGAIFIDRWLHLIQLKPDFIEIVTWNDWGESSYIGPADTTGLCPSCYWSNLDHGAFLKMTGNFIKAYKAGQTTMSVDQNDEDVFFFYRLHPAGRSGSQDNLPLPSDAEHLTDSVFIVSFLASNADITLSSGTTNHQISASSGVSKFTIPWTLGDQSLFAKRNGNTFVQKKGPQIKEQLERYNGNVIAL